MAVFATGKAGKKLCPLRPEATCAGAGCAMWRWYDHHISARLIHASNPLAITEPPRPKSIPESFDFSPADEEEGVPAYWVEPFDEAQQRRLGFCGLGGIPKVEE